MKQTLILLLLLVIPLLGFAQEIKMIKDWGQAKELAEKENKKILIILTGSEWCAPCKKMDKNVLATPDFKTYADEHLILFLVDLPGGGLVMNSKVYQDYVRFKKEYQADALPSLILVDKTGKKIKTLTGKMFNLENVLSQVRGL
jgi:thioredoxin-related protein